MDKEFAHLLSEAITEALSTIDQYYSAGQENT